MKQYFIYITGSSNPVSLSIGVTENLVETLIEQESNSAAERKSNNRMKLLYFEKTQSIFSAIRFRMEFENRSMHWKSMLIKSINPSCKDLFLDLLFKTNK